MGKELISQYAYLQGEIDDLQRRITKTESQIVRLQAGGTVLDSVKGTRQDGTIGNIRIEGFPVVSCEEKLRRLNRYRTQLYNSKMRATELVSEVEEYINSIEDSRMRRAIRYKFIDKLTWVATAEKLGGGNTADGVRKMVERFIGK